MNIKPLLSGVADYLKDAAGDHYAESEVYIKDRLANTEDRLLTGMIESVDGLLSPQFLAERMEEELGILESEAIAIGISTASFAQQVINTTVKGLLVVVIEELLKRKAGNES